MTPTERFRYLIHSPILVYRTVFQGRYDFVYDRMPMRIQQMPFPKRINLIKTGLNLVYRKPGVSNWPVHMQFELTNYCNLRCPVCPAGSHLITREKKAMDPALFTKVINETGPYLLTASLWAWGESLLHPHLDQILQATRKHQFVILLSTNGQNLDNPKVIDTLIQHPPTCLIVAIDGITDETNSQYRIGARLEPALTGVRRLAAMKRKLARTTPILQMRYIVMRHNEHEIGKLDGFAQENGFDMLSLRALSIIDSEPTQETHTHFVPSQSSWQAYKYKQGQRVRNPSYICQQPFMFPTVFADGTLVACEQDYNAQLAMGRLSPDTSFANLWFSKNASKTRQIIRDTPHELSFCENCPYRDRESTGCSVAVRHFSEGINPMTI
jgi:radical SAM protein with 4Fe4S-binding SPASM domain